jgi:hypothetical protein
MAIEVSVLAEQLRADESDCDVFPFEISSLVKTLLDLEDSELNDRGREGGDEAMEQCIRGSAEGCSSPKSLGKGGVIDLGDDRGLESGERRAAGVLRLVVLRLAD